MTDKITIDLYVVEQALEALREAQVLMERFQDEKLRRSAIEALRAALEQPQDGLPLVIAGAIFDFAGYLTTRPRVIEVGSTANASPIADLVKEFAKLRGLSLADAAVLSWQEWLKSASQQPQVEQEPVAWLHRCSKKPTMVELSFNKREPKLASKGYKAHPLYTHPQPKREPLTDEQIMELFRGVWTDGTQAGPVTPMAIRVARAIERAHGIGGEA